MGRLHGRGLPAGQEEDEGQGGGGEQRGSTGRVSLPSSMQKIPSDLLIFHLKIAHPLCGGSLEKHDLSQHKGRVGMCI